MKKLFDTTFKKIAALVAALSIVAAGLALAQTVVYQGYNANPSAAAGGGYNGLPGVVLAQTGPVGFTAATTGNTACAAAGSGTQVNGNVFKVVTSATTAVCVLVFPYAAPNGYLCNFTDITTPADLIHQASFTTTSCTASSATTGAADTIYVQVEAF